MLGWASCDVAEPFDPRPFYFKKELAGNLAERPSRGCMSPDCTGDGTASAEVKGCAYTCRQMWANNLRL